MQSIHASLANGPAAGTRPSHAEIARRAAQLWEERGRPNDRDEEIWLQAEQQLLNAQRQSQPSAARVAQGKSFATGGVSSRPRMQPVRISG
jgi:DUF2934 family protein